VLAADGEVVELWGMGRPALYLPQWFARFAEDVEEGKEAG